MTYKEFRAPEKLELENDILKVILWCYTSSDLLNKLAVFSTALDIRKFFK